MSDDKIKGKAWVYGDDVNTDVIFPGRYLHIFEPEEMAKHAMEDLDAEFVKGVSRNDVIIAGKNFGCGSSREQAATCLKHCGVGAIIAKSYARIFYRNAINQGLIILVSDEIQGMAEKGDEIEIDIGDWKVKNITKGKEIKVEPLPDFVMRIVKDGGLVPNLKKRLGTED